jgi:2-polyprenyl-6-methoxyphenol hydroxylase-like FAD-dependent oxidoreductase
MYDAIVTGARCAGSPTAMLLARLGYRVLAVDKATFPSDTMSTHIIWPAGLTRLRKWGLLDEVRATNCPPIRRVAMDIGDVRIACTALPLDGISDLLAPRRTRLDHIFVKAAASSGVEIREDFLVKEILWDGDRVRGIRGHSRSGGLVSEEARIVIGADGRNSMLAAAVKAQKYYERPPYCSMFYSYWSGVPVRDFEMYLREGFVYGSLPTNDGLTLIAALWNEESMPNFRDDVAGAYRRTLASDPRYADMMRRGRQEEALLGTRGDASFFRKPYGPGWALVGDAGYLKHPITAQGITDSFRDAELLASALDAGWSGKAPLEAALAQYERKRNEAALPMYKSTCGRAALKPVLPETRRFLRALSGNQEQVERYIGVDAGSVSHADFFSAENMKKIMGGGTPEATGATPQRPILR